MTPTPSRHRLGDAQPRDVSTSTSTEETTTLVGRALLVCQFLRHGEVHGVGVG
jgi:hypothetical protein